ncbi:hypothetical protein SVAN01_11141 [Stagonosporopsis vannaccii]|nr:hypothetical protein SVAN01_11141 [Stagonosporopsis vannaccii]
MCRNSYHAQIKFKQASKRRLQTPRFKTVKHLFDNDKNDVPKTLRRFAVARFTDAPQRSSDILQALRTQTCYKTGSTQVDTLKKGKLADTREVSRRDAKVVQANTPQNSIRIIDWEQRRADGHRALRVETGRSWVDRDYENHGSTLEEGREVKGMNAHSCCKSGGAPLEQENASLTNGTTLNRGHAGTPNTLSVRNNDVGSNSSVATNVLHTRLPGHNTHASNPAES